MTTNDSNDSVRNEQVGNKEHTKGQEKTEVQDMDGLETDEPVDDTTPQDSSSDVIHEDTPEDKNAGAEADAASIDDDKTGETKKNDSVDNSLDEVVDVPDEGGGLKSNNKTDVNVSDEDDTEEEAADESVNQNGGDSSESTERKNDEGKPTPPKYKPEQIDYAKLSKEDLVKVLKDLLNSGYIVEIRKEVEQVKTHYYKKHKADIEKIKENFLNEGGAIQDFKVEESPVETQLKELLNKYRELRNELNKKLEDEKEDNLKKKYDIIDKIKDLINSQESLNKTFNEFRDLQNQWREAGPVPQQNIKDLWDSYHYHVEAFYDYIKINKELRDLDFKKNLEAKLKLCETAESLLLEPSVVEAFRQLQKLHEQWREVGPIPVEKRSEMWDRFKIATTKINKKHQEYFVKLKQDQKKNYEEKIVLCEKAEEISSSIPDSYAGWEAKSKELIELQKVWKTIGFAPKKYNTQIYERFRKACDTFFNSKREFNSQNREEQQNNLQLKTELCMQAEAIQNSTDWKKTTSEFIILQKKWKEVGSVSPKQSDKIWKRFRAACDVFFNNKEKYYSNIDSVYEENLNKKNQLIEQIQNYEFVDDVEENLKALKKYQRQWSEIGFVPIKSKDEVQNRYRAAINEKFDKLKLDDDRKSLIKYRSRIEGIIAKPNSDGRLRIERDKCFNKLKQLENDITLWENNIGFFANSQNAESMIQDVKKKVTDAKKRVEQIKAKIRLLDEYDK